MMSLPEPHQQRFWQAILKLEKERKVEWISPLEQSFIDKGWKKGLEQGMELGRKQGALTVLERLLTRRFGPLPKTAQKKLAKADLGQLEAWSDALPEAQSLKQVFE
jgi:flagellar biosynthesis/type III secretory pathway protein FliH